MQIKTQPFYSTTCSMWRRINIESVAFMNIFFVFSMTQLIDNEYGRLGRIFLNLGFLVSSRRGQYVENFHLQCWWWRWWSGQRAFCKSMKRVVDSKPLSMSADFWLFFGRRSKVSMLGLILTWVSKNYIYLN